MNPVTGSTSIQQKLHYKEHGRESQNSHQNQHSHHSKNGIETSKHKHRKPETAVTQWSSDVLQARNGHKQVQQKFYSPTPSISQKPIFSPETSRPKIVSTICSSFIRPPRDIFKKLMLFVLKYSLSLNCCSFRQTSFSKNLTSLIRVRYLNFKIISVQCNKNLLLQRLFSRKNRVSVLREFIREL